MSSSLVFPELVTGRRDGLPDERWHVREGWALRGHASCDFVERVVEVPFGLSPVDRIVRSHELVHVRVSPHDVNPLALYPDLPRRTLECAEEFRVNWVLGQLGFDVSVLRDGSEVVAGERVALSDAWGEAACFFVAVLGTGAERDFVKGLRRHRPTWPKALSALKRRVTSFMRSLSVDEVADTHRSPSGSGLPVGFERVSVPIAELLSRTMTAAVPETPEQLRQFARSLEPGGRRPPSGVFAELVLAPEGDMTAVAQRRFVRRTRANVSGRRMRYPSRILTDPQRRAFDDTRRSVGGIVIIDQSGSMDVPEEDLDTLLSRAPAALVIGYSHRPGDRSAHPNAWVLAAAGRRCSTIPAGNVGNGVDGPVLRWALTLRRGNEPVVWVTDGQVTDSNDHPNLDLARECAELVRRHRILLVRSVSDAAARMSGTGLGAWEDATTFGRVGRALVATAM